MNIKTMLAGFVLTFASAAVYAIPVTLDINFDILPEATSFGIWEAESFDSAAMNSNFFRRVPYNPVDAAIGFGDGFVVASQFSGHGAGSWQFIWDLTEGADYEFYVLDGVGNFAGQAYQLVNANGAMIFSSDASASSGRFTATAVTAVPVPEPGILVLLGLGLIGVAVARRRPA